MAERASLQPREPVAALGAAQQNRQLVAELLAAAVGEDGRPVGQARTVRLVVLGRKSSDAPAVWQHGAANLGATAACGMIETAREERFINNEAREGEVFEKSLRAAVPGGKGQCEPFGDLWGPVGWNPKQIAPKRGNVW